MQSMRYIATLSRPTGTTHLDARYPSQTYAMTNQTISDQQLEARQGGKIDYYDHLKVHLRDSKMQILPRNFHCY